MQRRHHTHMRDHRGSVREYNIVVLGAGGVGKSCLTAQFVQNVWIEHYDPTIEDSYRKQIEVDGRQCVLEILDTAGTDQFAAMREIYMKTGQGFLLVFSITSFSSLQELAELRDQIIQIKDDEKTPLVIVGNKSDLEDERSVTRAQAFAVSQAWGNAPYYETSARRRTNVDEVFRDLCRQIIHKDTGGVGVGGKGSPDLKRSSTKQSSGLGGGGGASGGAGGGQHSRKSRRRRGGGGGGGGGGREERRCTIL